MAINGALRLALTRSFEALHRALGRPALYAIPWQVPAGLSYDADVDAWIDGSGAVADPDLYSLTYNAIPALWGMDAEALVMALAGVSVSGDAVAIALAEYQPQLDGALMVRAGSPTSGEKYSVTRLENAPDGGAAVFVVAGLQRRER